MKEEILVRKWLKDELTSEELEAFKKLDAYSSYLKLSEKAKNFKAPAFDESDSLEKLKANTFNKTKTSNRFSTQLLVGLVALLVIAFAVFKILNTGIEPETYKTDVADFEIIDLPDQSEVHLSAKSSLTFNPDHWDKDRNVTLSGEAFFKVETGNSFTVHTSYGNIQVLGTQFNVKSRDYGFEVTCFEGSVRVTIDDKPYILHQKDILVLKENSVMTSQTIQENPDWKRNSTFIKSKPLAVVLKEFQNYYRVDFETASVNTSRLYTGSFGHSDIEIALKSITLPLNLTYQIKDEKVILSNK